MATTSNTYTGNGSNKLFSITFPYLDTTDIDVYLNGTLQTITTHYFFANATTVEFVAAPANGVSVRIQRDTDNTGNKSTFFPGSSIRAADLNENFDQALFVRQELIDTSWNNTTQTIESVETWVSSDAYIATTQATDQRVDFKIDTALTGDVFGSDGVSITDNSPGSGQITVGLTAGSVDLDRIKDADIITTAEQDAGSPSWVSDDTKIPTIGASAKRFDTIVQTGTPVASNYQVGKTWLQNDANKTLSVWNGSAWLGVASGGTFTTQPTVIYVDATNGNDADDGHRIINPKKTIKAAVIAANAGDIIKVAPGVYQEVLPIDVTVTNLSIVGEAQRSCFIHPTVATEQQTMFRCNSGTYIDGFTFAGLKASGTRGDHYVDTDATYGLPANQGWVAGFYPGCTITKSPYVNNCTNFADSGIDNSNFNPNNHGGTGGDTTSAPTGGGILVDGSIPDVNSPLRSFVINEFTQINLDGPGLLVCNNGYVQAVSFFGIFCHYHAKALSGGQINMEVGTTNFGRYGLIADGKSNTAIFTATANGAVSTNATTFAINAPTAAGSWFGDATRPALNMLVQVSGNLYPILSATANGAGWNVVISRPNPSNRAENLGLISGHSNGAAVSFFLRSMISTASHTHEYTGAGTSYLAMPENGGVPIEANESVNLNNGRVWLSSVDQNGKFKVGDTFAVDQQTGFVTIDPNSYSTNLVSDLTPELGGDLDVLTRSIYSSLGDIGIADAFNTGANLLLVRESSLATAYPFVTQYDIGTDPNQVPLNGHLGTMAFQDSAGVNLGTASIGQIVGPVSIDLGTAAAPTINFTGDTNTGIYSPGADQFAISTGGVQRATVDSSGRLLFGTSTARLGNVYASLQLEGSNSGTSKSSIIGRQSGVPQLFLGFHGGTANGQTTLVANGNSVGQISFNGADGTDFRIAATITGQIDGTPGANDMPGRLVFSTTSDGAASPTERMRIDSTGLMTLTGPGIKFPAAQVASADPNTLDDYEEGTWTPSGVTAPLGQSGTYVKIGTLVTCRGVLAAGGGGTLSASVASGLPFAHSNTTLIGQYHILSGGGIINSGTTSYGSGNIVYCNSQAIRFIPAISRTSNGVDGGDVVILRFVYNAS
jgi:hypothetical protein